MAAATIAVVTIVQMVIWNAISKHKAESNEPSQDSSESESSSNFKSLPRSTRSVFHRSDDDHLHFILSNKTSYALHSFHQLNASMETAERSSLQNVTEAFRSLQGNSESAAVHSKNSSHVDSPDVSASLSSARRRRVFEPGKRFYQGEEQGAEGDGSKVISELRTETGSSAQNYNEKTNGWSRPAADKLKEVQTQAVQEDRMDEFTAGREISQSRNVSQDRPPSTQQELLAESLSRVNPIAPSFTDAAPRLGGGSHHPDKGKGGSWLTSTSNVELLCSNLPHNSSDAARLKRRRDLRCSCFLSHTPADFIACQLSSLQPVDQSLAEFVRSMKWGKQSGESAYFHTKRILSFGTRVPGDEGWNRTIGYISGFFKTLGWFVEEDRFLAHTPVGVRPMCNIVASLNPKGGVCLVDLAAHLDSKLFADFRFLGASDSVASMGIMLEVAESISLQLQRRMLAEDVNLEPLPCLRMIFFDGEESFKRWTPTDSLYGSRHLASSWERQLDPFRPGKPRLDGMRLLVLLDLIGGSRSTFVSHHKSTSLVFQRLQLVEQSLRRESLLRARGGSPTSSFFASSGSRETIQDDHIPFLKRKVPVLHLIPSPFPPFWHTTRDTLEAIDRDAVADFAMILKTFLFDLYGLIVRKRSVSSLPPLQPRPPPRLGSFSR